MSIVYLNGNFLPADEAKISVLDRGFLLGDGVYEVIPAYSGSLFRLEEHLQRLQKSLDAIHLDNPMSHQQWTDALNMLVEKNYAKDLSVYLQVTRGIAVRDHAFPEKVQPTIYAMANPISPLDPKYYQQGVAAITLEDLRWKRCDIKSISLLANVLLRQQAVERGVAEAILVRDGFVTEGAASNVFVVHNNTIMTAPKGQYILPGITRDLILELADQHGFAYQEKAFSEQLLREAEEVWITSSTKEILPVTQLDGVLVGSGKPGLVWHKMCEIYAAYKSSLHAAS